MRVPWAPLPLLLLAAAPVAWAFATPPPNGTAVFFEPFDAPFEGRWQVSTSPEYTGEWGWSAPEDWAGGEEDGDRGLLVQSAARKSAVAVTFPQPVTFASQEERPLVVQYEVKLQHGLLCGGAYLKLLTQEGAQADPFDSGAPFGIMFGPDKCADTNKVHFILKHRHPVTGEPLEKAAVDPPRVPSNRRTHLYTLILFANDTFEMLVDLESRLTGHLLEDLDPPINPPAEVDDPTDVKPADWVDEAEMPDPAAVKPEDWDESEPRMIPDAQATRPEDWDETVAPEIPDPDAAPPETWVEEEDGVWEAPLVPNPRCPKGACGPWSPPLVPNPEYKGPWQPPLIPNPAYRGPWAPRQIPNPAFFVDPHPFANLQPLHGLGLELWTMQDGALFDNFLVTRDVEAALSFARATWLLKSERELQAERDKPRGWVEWLTAQNPWAFWGTFVLTVLLLPFGLWYLCARSYRTDRHRSTSAARDESADDSAAEHTEQPTSDEDEEPTSGPGQMDANTPGLHKRVPHTAE